MVLIDKAALVDAIGFANDHPAMPDFYDIKEQVRSADKVMSITAKQAALLKEALIELSSYLDTDEEYDDLEKLLEALS